MHLIGFIVREVLNILWMHEICWTLLVLEYQNHCVCVCVCVCVWVWVWVYVYVCVCVFVCVCVYVCVWVCVCVSVCVCEYVCVSVCVCMCVYDAYLLCVFRCRHPETFAHPVFLSLYILAMCHCCLLGPFSATNRNRQCRTGENILNYQSRIANWKYHGICRVSFRWSIRK